MIGIFDSGIGGLTVRSEIIKLMPAESTIYYADGKNCPYGHKSVQEITDLADDIVRFLIERGAKIIVIACNAATAAAISYLRATYPDTYFVGMEPAVKPAAMATKTGVIGIMATKRTLSGRLFTTTSAMYADKIRIIECEGEDALVDIVENNQEDTDAAKEVISRHLEPMIKASADHIVLGCTHYPFLSRQIADIAGDGVSIIDPAPAIARRVRQIMRERGILADKNSVARHQFFSSDDEVYLQKVVAKSKML